MSYRHICSRDYVFIPVFRTTVSRCLGGWTPQNNVVWGSWAWTKSCSNSLSSRDLHFVSVFWTAVSHCTGFWTPQNKYWTEGFEPGQWAAVIATTTVLSPLSSLQNHCNFITLIGNAWKWILVLCMSTQGEEWQLFCKGRLSSSPRCCIFCLWLIMDWNGYCLILFKQGEKV